MPICPYCKGEINLDNIVKETKGAGIFKQEIIYACPNCDCVLGVGRGKYT